jgi:hypothetical protein
MNARSTIAIIFLSIFFICGQAYGLEVTNGNVKLVLHEDTGRFSLYYMVNPETKKYVSMLVDQDIRTSFLSLLIDNKVTRMGESSQFKEKLEKKETGATRTWTSDWLEVTENFKFTASDNKDTDGVKITLSIKNKGDVKTIVGARYLFDTYLGERNGAYFVTDKSTKTENEVAFDKENMIQYFITPQEPAGEPVKVGLKMITKGTDVTTPDKLVFANWKRLSDSLWSYSPPAGRNFSVRPYSINDSAVALYYNPASLSKGETKDISVSLSFYGSNEEAAASANNTTQAKEEAASELLDILSKAKKTTPLASNLTSAENLKLIDDLSTIENLINEINRILKLMEQMIAELNDRMKNY